MLARAGSPSSAAVSAKAAIVDMASLRGEAMPGILPERRCRCFGQDRSLLPLQHRLAALAPSLVRLLLVLGQLQRHEAVEIGIGRLAQRAVHPKGDRLL